MEYVATQRCPCCTSTDTRVKLVELPRSHKYHEPGLQVSWLCRNCRTSFEPSSAHLLSPVLMCEKCRVPTKHTFHRTDRGVFRSLASEVQPTDVPIVHELYACPCGEIRIYGSVGLPVPILSVVGRSDISDTANIAAPV
jgi:hypothetical protein